MIALDHVSRRFGRTPALSDATLHVAAGDSVALWGTNGAGKTTLIRCVLGLLRFQGRIRVGGHDVRRSGKRARRLIGYVPQELAFYDDLGVREAVAFFARLKGLGRVRAQDVLAGVGLIEHGAKRIRELSGGMKQRLALAIAMLGDPPILVLDEVTASLDACGRREFVALLARMSGEGRTLLFASHRLEEITQLARRVVVLDGGRIAGTHDAAGFQAFQGLDAMLHLVIGPPHRGRAAEELRASGFAPTTNGIGLMVPVTQAQKAAPFRVLAAADITIDDFDLLPVNPACSLVGRDGGAA